MPYETSGRVPARRARHALLAVAVAAALVLGQPTAPSDAAAPRPGKPKVLKVFVKGTTTIQARWSSATRATRYQVLVATDRRMTKGRKVLRTTGRTVRVTGLRQGTVYYVRVRAYRGKKVGAWGPQRSKRTLYATPGAPRVTATGTGFASAVVRWTKAPYATRYRVVVSRGSTVVQRSPWVTTRSRAVSGLATLPAGSFYSTRVEANNAGQASRVSAPVRLLLTPYAPTGARVAATSPGGVTLTWTRASNAQRYELRARPRTGGGERASATIDLAEGVGAVNGLTQGAAYDLAVRAVSGSARSAWVEAGTATAGTRAYSLQVGTYNVACANREAPCSSPFAWGKRRDYVADLVNRVDYDVVGTQETSATKVANGLSQGSDLLRLLDDEYAAGVHYRGRWIYYNRVRLEAGEGGSFSIGYSTGTRKTQHAVWQVFTHRATGQRFAVVNAHMDSYIGLSYDRNRHGQTKTLLSQTAKVPELKGLTIIHVGDYNSHELRDWDGPRAAFLGAGYLDADDFAVTQTRRQFNSANGWRNPNLRNSAQVDHVYVPRTVGVRSSAVDLDTDARGRWRGQIPSDHNPVRAVLEMPRS